MAPLLHLRNLHISIGEKEVVKGLHLTVQQGEMHAIMGPNGSGKSTLAQALMGHPRYTITEGSIQFHGDDITTEETDARARRGLFLAFQYPLEVPGVPLSSFLRQAHHSITGESISVAVFRKRMRETAASLKLDETFLERPLNEGFSGGEKKKCEILQMALLKPRCMILDETDSGLDIDALQTVAQGVNALMDGTRSALIITHYQRILRYCAPQFVHIMVDGAIVQSGGKELAEQLERDGYKAFV